MSFTKFGIESKLTPDIVRRIKYIYAYDRRMRRLAGKKRASDRLRKNMADRVFAWTGIRVSTNTIKAIVARKPTPRARGRTAQRWASVKVKVQVRPTLSTAQRLEVE